MKHLLAPALLAAALLAGCNQQKPAETGTAAPVATTAPAPSLTLAAFFDRYWEGQSRLNPLDATSQGDNRHFYCIRYLRKVAKFCSQ